MKKFLFLILIASILSACQPAQTPSQTSEVSETSEVFPALTPTPTLHPQFIALQEKIAASGGRFTLQADGHIYDGETPIPGVTVSPDGTMSLTVDGETVTLDPADVDFDDEAGITIDGYSQDPETGAWVEATETITLGGVTMTLDENGVVTDMVVNGNYTPEQKAEKMEAVDPTNWGFDEGEAQIIKGEDGKIYLTPAGEPETKIASWYYGTGEWEWDWNVMNGMEGGNPLFDDFAKTFATTDEGKVRQTNEVRADAAEIRSFAVGYTIYLYNGTDKTEAIIATYSGDDKGNNKLDPNAMLRSGKSEVVDGTIGFKTKSGEIVKMRFKDVEVFIRGFN